MMTAAQYSEMANTLVSDIEALVPLVFTHNSPVCEANIRLASTIMRKWIVDGDLKKLTSPFSQSVTLYAKDNSTAHTYVNESGKINYYLTAGVQFGGRPISHIYDSDFNEKEIDRSFASDDITELSLRKFKSQPRLFHNGTWFNTGQILHFAANKLGGNHLDFDRSGEWERLDQANKYMRFGGPQLTQPPNGTKLYLVIEPTSTEIVGGVHLEVLAAVASFVQMKIDGRQLLTLESKPSLADHLRRLLRRQPKPFLIERE